MAFTVDQDVWKSSGTFAVDTAVKATPGIFGSVILTGDGTNLATMVVYDHASAASGTVIARAATKECAQVLGPVSCANGIYADIGGTGAAAVVLYK